MSEFKAGDRVLNRNSNTTSIVLEVSDTDNYGGKWLLLKRDGWFPFQKWTREDYVVKLGDKLGDKR